ncbi:MAG: hypothetical protein ACKOCX_04565 [Planctomycetota bacterium]
MARHALLSLACAGLIAALGGRPTRADLPRFSVPGSEHEMAALNALHELHHEAAFSDCTLWDPWLPMATVWASPKKREQYRTAFLNRRIDAEGYVAMQQHRGGAHSEGWPFPAWGQCGGAGFYFSTADEAWAVHALQLKPLKDTAGWEFDGADVLGIDPVAGLRLKATKDVVTITTPPFRCGTIVAPFARLEWAARGLEPESQAGIEWLLDGEADWPANRRVAFPPPQDMQYANVPLYRQPGYAGLLTRYRVTLDHAAGAEIDLRSIVTAIDTRHPITNSNYIRGCCDYVAWTADLDFLRHAIGRMRRALTYALDEFRVREGKHVFVPWVGHDGRSGIALGPNGQKAPRLGLGVGNNYWDLLPFGGHDALATIYLYDALRGLASLEESLAKHPEWMIPPAQAPHDGPALRRLAEEIRKDFQSRFWNRDTGRFNGWIDAPGRPYDYGFTFVNLESIFYGLASEDQARSIFDWLDGRREVAGDTSAGADIYRWRFAPRATTRRNVEAYVWAWPNPEQIPWGGQVQDGGAVLGFSYHDLMARLKTNGPDDAWRRLEQILAWFREVQAEGGYRAYYAKPDRGTLQGGGTAGGLGLDHEFMESVLVPQVMLYGFLGFQPSLEGYRIEPRLPAGWPSLTITGIRFHDEVLDVPAHADGRIEVANRPAAEPAGSPP